ncbi:MAG: RecQ family ATP-dependent DNA helicase [Chlorobi bacterium]|nr:RecQ family ATP-dependent DNA helicase [Chlorobiota bacterium]
MATTLNLEHALRQTFGHDSFRPGQREIISAVLDGRDTLGVLPTGSGKSLCYQLPAVISDGVTIVISPLIALMHDQVGSLFKRGIPASAITSSIGTDEIAFRLYAAQRGQLRLLYIAPERIESSGFIEQLRRIRIARVVVDEAHCISQWGHDFRPAYLSIKTIRSAIGYVPICALTATAPPQVQRDIIQQLGLRDPLVYVGNFDRPNLTFRVEFCPPDRSYQQKIARVVTALERTTGAAIIYVSSRKAAESLAAQIARFGIAARSYHAGIQDNTRERVHQWFLEEPMPVVVATVAFGMGIDKPNVRYVGHCDLPLSLENYYQEAGRAGRDGHAATCTLYYATGDERKQRILLERQYPPRAIVENLYNLIAERLRVGAGMYSDRILPVETASLAQTLSCSQQQVSAALDFLERHDLIRRRGSNDALCIRIATSAERWHQYCTTAAPELLTAFDVLLRVIPPEAYHDDVAISLAQLEHHYGVSSDNLYRAVRAAELARLLHVTYATPNDGIRLWGPRYTRDELPIDWATIQQRKDLAEQKAATVLEYVRSHRCKRWILLGYFGQDYTMNCGRCSSCTRDSSTSSAVTANTSYLDEHSRKVLLQIVASCGGKVRAELLVARASGKNIEPPASSDNRIDNASGVLSFVPERLLHAMVQQLIAEGYLRRTRLGDVVEMTNPGWRTIGVTPPQRSSNRTPVTEELNASVRMTIELALNGATMAQIAAARQLTPTTVVSHLVQAIEAGVQVPRKQLISESLYIETYRYVQRHPQALLRDVHAYFKGAYDHSLLRLALAFARRELRAR